MSRTWTYAERRAQALKLADEYRGWGLPPRPEGNQHNWSPRYVPHAVAVRLFGASAPPPDRYGFCLIKSDLRTMAYFEAKERNQNRRLLND